MRTITLELLRHGVAHNQLLSPLTPYLALCENHAAVTLHVPFEHNQFLHRLRALGYKLKEESRIFQLQDTARTIGDLLALIPGLTAESNKEQTDEDNLTHLRLIISAAELALLPFELAQSPNGLPGSGQYLLLQPQMPICLTREIRRVPSEQLQWPKTPKILFAAAAPVEGVPIPLESHLLALRRVIKPWMKYYDSNDQEMRRKRVEEHLVFLPGASVEAIEEACATGGFTHVHILAHGVERPENHDTRFFLALHKARNPEEMDYVSGARLATALRASQRAEGRGLSKPAVVTLASCNSGSVGSVAGAGASIAHALHEAGIPMVVASQFPLSFPGSVRLVEVLYEGFLSGNDPRLLLHDLRRRLHAQFPETHDWASLTAYASLPANIDRQLANVQIAQASRSIEAALNYADEVIRRADELTHRTPSTDQTRSQVKLSQTAYPQTDRWERENKKVLKEGQEKIEQARRKLERLLARIPSERADILGRLASTEKRQAEIFWFASLLNPDEQEDGKKEAYELLRKACDHYWEAFVQNPASSWMLVQYLALALILKKLRSSYEASLSLLTDNEPDKNEQPKNNLEALWWTAQISSLNELFTRDRTQMIWAHGNLIELYLLALMILPETPRLTHKEAETLALKHTNDLLALAGRDSFEAYTTRRQIFRYVGWFREIADIDSLQSLAVKIFNKFPADIEEKWK